MGKKKVALKKTHRKSISLIKMSPTDARAFFLKPENYCSIKLPDYFQFGELLDKVERVLSIKNLDELRKQPPGNFDGVNYSLYNNKDGKYAWRPLQLIHPAIYVSLVNEITAPKHWKQIVTRFRDFQKSSKVKCVSVPVKSESIQSNIAEQVSRWWEEFEQASLEMSIEFDYAIHTDIVDCYGSIYTHSIAWALHTKPIAKIRNNRNEKKLLGNIIDSHLKDMRYGQTNGIPQGSVLMDFIAEIVLGYADSEISKRAKSEKISDFRMLRYRDDYRVFTNNSQDGERILKIVTEIMIDLGFKLGGSKTTFSNRVVVSSIKKDKLDWICRKNYQRNWQKQLLLIHNHSIEHPNSGTLVSALGQFHKRIVKTNTIQNPIPLIGILVDIAFHNPRTYPIFSAILSKLLVSLNKNAAKSIVKKIKKKFEKLPNTGHMQLWLQRISYPVDKAISYDEPVCQLAAGNTPQIWNNDWISSKALIKVLDPALIVDRTKLDTLARIVPVAEMRLFINKEGYG